MVYSLAEQNELENVNSLKRLVARQIEQIEYNPMQSTITRLYGCEIKSILTVGVIQDITSTASNTRFILKDGTGSINCILWNATDIHKIMIDIIQEGALVKVIGVITSKPTMDKDAYAQETEGSTEKVLNCFYIGLVTSKGYQKYHVACSVLLENAMKKQAISKEDPRTLLDREKNQLNTSFIYNDMPSFISQPEHKENNEKKNSNYNGETEIESDVLRCFRQNQDERGVDRNIIVLMLESTKRYSRKDLEKAIEHLLETNRLCFTTSNNDILAAVDGVI
ncbi:hypothetical protein NEOKW01_1218 [Nematocida sp. AWRm80]|nr:hypothetical protein NEOKW01_1218 [Nematocida sp. AWRm80]